MRFPSSVFRSAAVAMTLTLAISAPAATQPAVQAAPATRQTITVEGFDGAEMMGGVVSAEGLSALLIDVLIDSGRFTVVERGTAVAPTARFLVKGSITKYNPAARGAGINVGGMSGLARGLGGGVKARTTTVSISLRLIESSTGQILAVGRAEGTATSQEADAGVIDGWNGAAMGVNAVRSTSMGKALEDAMRKAIVELSAKVGA